MKRKGVAVLLLTATFLAGGITGCQNAETENIQEVVTEESDVEQETSAENSEQEESSYTITFYDSDGITVLSTAEVAAGKSPEEYIPEKEGYTFVGWYATPTMSHKFDFSQEITADTEAFAGFVSYVEDTRTFAILGSGTSPVLFESNWGAVIGDAQMMSKQDADGANIYEITLDLAAGDEFQFAINSSWHNQRGYGYLDTIVQDGTEYFENSGSIGETSTKRSNIKCAVAGNYTFTLTTYPGEDIYETENANYSDDNKEAFNINPYDVITWTYNGAAEVASDEEKQVDYYIKGAEITGWEDVYSDETKFTEADGIYSLTVELTEGDEFMFTSTVTVGDQSGVGTEYIRYTNIASDDTESLSYVTGTESANLIAASAGNYTFTYDPQTQVLTVSLE